MSRGSGSVERRIAEAGTLWRSGRAAEAERLLLGLLATDRRNGRLLEALEEFYLAGGRTADAMRVLERQIEIFPQDPPSWFRLGALLQEQRRWVDLAGLYGRMTTALPDLADAHYNHGVFLARCDEHDQAITAFRRALELDISAPAEAWLNIGNACTRLRREADAQTAFEQALRLDPRYVPALYNLGLLHEEHGRLQEALAAFERILGIDPGYHDALVRIANARRVTDAADPLLTRLHAALDAAPRSGLVRESLHFALGKAFDDCGCYDEAFAHYAAGNACSRARVKPYDRAGTEAGFTAIASTFGADWLARCEPVADRPLIFICGMFRSGSTLVEQLLAGHPAITGGGEIDHLPRTLATGTFPAAYADPQAQRSALQTLGNAYLQHLERITRGGLVTDKRPDNFRYLGLLKGLFPRLRIVHTVRDPLDTCLSIWFQQLDDSLGYACSLEDTGHYYRHYRRLMAHWKALFPHNILNVDYDRMVREPEPCLRELLAFLDLPRDPRCLEFHQVANRVRTASVWQVREALHASSSGRWRHYTGHLDALFEELGIDP